MKRLFILFCILTMLFALAGCSANDETNADATPAPDVQAADALADQPLPVAEMQDALSSLPAEPEPEQTPVPNYKPSDYTYNDIQIQELSLALTYPSFYEIAYTTNTVTFTQPVEEGKTPIRIAVSIKDYTGKMTIKGAAKEVRSFREVLAKRYDRFKSSKLNNTIVFMNRSALSFTYQAIQGDTQIKGMVIMTGVEANNKIYALHMCAPRAQFNDLQKAFKKVMYSCAPIY